MIHDVLQRLQFPQVFGFDFRRIRQFFPKNREDLHTLDGVDPQVAVKGHVQFEHLDRISGGFRYGRKKRLHDLRCPRPVRVGDNNGRKGHRFVTGITRCGQMLHDILQGFQFSQVFGFDFRRIRQFFPKNREDLHTLDGVDPQIAV